MAPADKSPQTAPTSNEHEPNLAAVASLRVCVVESDALLYVLSVSKESSSSKDGIYQQYERF